MELNRVEKIVYNLLIKQKKPLSAYDILALAKDAGVKSPPLIYRALKKLASKHLAHRLEALNGYIACQDHGHQHQHHFFICQNCHTVFEDDSNNLNQAIQESSRLNQFHVKRSIIEVLGLCSLCQV